MENPFVGRHSRSPQPPTSILVITRQLNSFHLLGFGSILTRIVCVACYLSVGSSEIKAIQKQMK